MAYSVYVTDYGEVKASPAEGRWLEMAHWVEREGLADKHPYVVERARGIREACERFAKWKLDHA